MRMCIVGTIVQGRLSYIRDRSATSRDTLQAPRSRKILFTCQQVVLSILQEQFTQVDIPPTMTR